MAGRKMTSLLLDPCNNMAECAVPILPAVVAKEHHAFGASSAQLGHTCFAFHVQTLQQSARSWGRPGRCFRTKIKLWANNFCFCIALWRWNFRDICYLELGRKVRWHGSRLLNYPLVKRRRQNRPVWLDFSLQSSFPRKNKLHVAECSFSHQNVAVAKSENFNGKMGPVFVCFRWLASFSSMYLRVPSAAFFPFENLRKSLLALITVSSGTLASSLDHYRYIWVANELSPVHSLFL